MGVITYEDEINSSIPPTKMFKAFILDADNLYPKAVPETIKSVEILEGDGGVGTVKLVTFAEGTKLGCAKHRVDEIDEANHTFKYSVIEGDALHGVLDSISYVVKFEAGPDGGSVVKIASTYHTKSDEHHFTVDKIKEGKEKAKAMYKAIEAHLHAHPESYN